MGRKEKPLDPAAGAVQRFAFELRKLRDEAGAPTYRAMAGRVGYSGPTLSAAASGDRLPTLPVLSAYVTACDGDVREWTDRWRAAVAESAEPVDPLGEGDSPYPGLARFDTGDRDHFHGRDATIAELLALTARRRVSAVVGASGSGKSSLLRAGLVAALRDPDQASTDRASTDRARTDRDGTGRESTGRPAALRVLTPGTHPARTHADRFTPHPGPGDTVVVVDQFEETFALCADPDERERFIGLLLTALAPDSRLRVVLAVRADFYGRCAAHGPLAAALRDSTLLIGPMSAPQLREAVVRPAAARRLIVERTLTARIVADVAGEPGGLPLMAHALREVWRRRTGKTLTLAAYEAIGGVHGAVAHTAETLHTQGDAAERAAVRRVLLRLVTPGEGTADTRRPVDRAELGADPDTARVLERLVRARLLTVDGDTVDLAHEALIGAWPRLRGWLEEDRERLRVHRRLTQAARAWDELAHDEGALYRGVRLSEAREVFETVPGELSAPESAFLAASVAADERERRTAARATRRLRAMIAGLAVLLCLAAVAGFVAWRESEAGERRRAEAEARRAAALSESLRAAEPRTAMRLALAGWRLADLPETRQSLRSAAAQSERDVFVQPDPGALADNAPEWLSADGRILTSVVEDRAVQWDVRRHRQMRSMALPGLSEHIRRVSRDGRLIAYSAPGDRDLRITDLVTGHTRRYPTGPGLDVDVEFGASGRFFALRRGPRSTDGRAALEVWDIERQRRVLRYDRGDDHGPVPVLDAHDRYLAWCAESGGRLRILDVRRGRTLDPGIPRATEQALCLGPSLLITPDGRAVASATDAGVVTWDFTERRERPRLAAEAGALDVVFAGPYAATWQTGALSLWRTDGSASPDDGPREPVLTSPVTGSVVGDLRLDLRDGVLRHREGANSNAVRTTSLQGLTGLDRPPKEVGPRTVGDGYVAVDRARDRALTEDGEIVDLTGGAPLVLSSEEAIFAGAFSPDGRLLAVADIQGRITLWDLELGRRTAVLSTSDLHNRHRRSLAFSPDGALLAAGSNDGSVRVWETASPQTPAAVFPVGDPPVVGLRFDASGRLRVETSRFADRVRELTPERAAELVCERTRGASSESEWLPYLPSTTYQGCPGP
ncbi:hypothetical protein [Streptomyces sp. NPDC088789]|uniref:nSTAND1 domain-containing NTPase n=1 Tax=Streptomyces sp. NPDC088789 TaxID=3365899 RepID=UPI0037F1C317